MSKKADTRIGYIGESWVTSYLRRKMPDMLIVWTNEIKPQNKPFDCEVWDGNRLVAGIEVKALSENRKHFFTQLKRPAIKRKKAYLAEHGGRAYTVVAIKCNGEFELRFAEGLPSISVDRFDENMTKLVEAMLDADT